MPETEANGVRLYYEIHGGGEPLALVHGSWVDATRWGFVVPGLAESFRVLVYDRRGHSRSERPDARGSVDEDGDDLAALLETLDLVPLRRGCNPRRTRECARDRGGALMSEQLVNGVRLHYEAHGAGAPIMLIHGCGSSALGFADAVEKLAGLGRVIAYDRRGCARSERPEPYERTSVAEHADDAAGLLDALGACPAIVIGRSYGGTVASDLALRYPDRVRALVLLEPDAPRELAPAAAEWVDALGDRLRQVSTQIGVDAVGEALITEVAGERAWRAFPDEWRRVVIDNGPAILAELEGEWWLEADAAELATIEQPALLVAAADSPPEFREPIEAMAHALPNALSVLVEGGHIIDPAAPEVLAFIKDVVGRAQADTAGLRPSSRR